MNRVALAASLLAVLAVGACATAAGSRTADGVPAAARAAAAFVAALHGDAPGAVTVVSVASGAEAGLAARCPSVPRPGVGEPLLVTLATPRGEETMVTDRDGSVLARCAGAPAPLQAVIAEVARQHGAAASDVTVESREAVTFSDGALGCPEPGRLYTQATVPGYRLVLRIAGAGTAEIHTDRDGTRWVECRDGRPVHRGSVR